MINHCDSSDSHEAISRQSAQLQFLKSLHDGVRCGRPDDYMHVVRSISSLVPYHHCSLWYIDEYTSTAILVAQDGDDIYLLIKGTIQPLKDAETHKEARNPQDLIFIRDPEKIPDDDPQANLGILRNKVSVPVFSGKEGRFIAQVIIFPRDQSDNFSPDKKLLQIATSSISAELEHCHRVTELALWSDMLSEEGACPDSRLYAQRFGTIIHKHIPCEGWSIFIMDTVRNRLLLAGSSGIRGNPQNAEVYYTLDDDRHVLPSVARSKTTLNEYYPDGSWERIHSPLFIESTKRDTLSYLATPLFGTQRHLVGIIRLRNRIEPLSGDVSCFSGFDKDLLERGARVIGAHVELSHSDATRTQMLNLLTHEVNSPAASIKVTSDRLVREFSHLPVMMITKELSDIQSSAELLVWLYEGVSHFLRTPDDRHKQYDFRTWELKRNIGTRLIPVIRTLAREYNRPFSDFSVRLHDIRIECDRNMILLVLINIMRNAIKYSNTDIGRKNQIILESKCPQGLSCDICGVEYHDGIEINASDNGIGVPEGQEEAIFTGGIRLENARRIDMKGIGLGLTLSRLIVSDHGGCMHVTSNRNPTTITVRMSRCITEK